MITVGLDRVQYAEQRNIIAPNRTRADFRQIDSLPVPSDAGANFSRFAYRPRQTAGVDVFHLFNSIPLTDMPFVVTTEAGLPRWRGAPPTIMLDGWRRLAASNCGRILAISHNAVRMIAHELRACPQALRQDIEAKLEVLYPPQDIPVRQDRAKFRYGGPLRLAFVGRDFLRKGGCEFVRALHTLVHRRIAFHATIVSELRVPGTEDEPWNHDAARRIAEARALLAALGDRVEFHESLSNPLVLDLFARSHLGVLPSLGEPFGYAVLEAASRFCATLTTTIRAFPEINGDDTGWLVPLPVTPLGTLDRVSIPFEEVSNQLYTDLADAISGIADGGLRAIQEKAECALARVRTWHDPAAAGDRLREIYEALPPRRRRQRQARPRVLWITANFAPQIGGLQAYTADMIGALRTDLDIAIATDATQNAPENPEIRHIRVANLGVAPDAGALARTGRAVVAAATGFGADIVHFANANMAVYRDFLPASLPVVASVHGNDLTAPWQRIGQEEPGPRIRAGLAACQRIIAVSRHTEELIRQSAILARVTTIQNSCDLARFYPSVGEGAAVRHRYGIAPDCLVLLTLGRLVPRKGHATISAALSLFDTPADRLCWLVAGDGPWQGALQARAAHDAPGVRTIFTGQLPAPELRAFYNACDIFVSVPSALRDGGLLDSEGFGIVFLEAAACGKPVIAADLAGCRDAVIQGHTGLLIPPDEPEVLAAAIRFLAEDLPARSALGAYGMAAVRACDGWAGVAKRVRGVYDEVMTDARSSANLLRHYSLYSL
jgi:phosphatidylinositol alpha-1,6-mannosyltransferase